MTFDPNADISGGRTSKRGRNTAIGVGGGGIVAVIAVLLISQLTGVDLTGLLGGGTGGGASQEQGSPLESCTTGEQANSNTECRVKGASAYLGDYWAGHVQCYTDTQVQLFSGQTQTGCGAASTAVGPFYCPSDQTIYLDTTFYDELRSRFGTDAGPLAQLYVIAHEWGHHIQKITGRMDGLDLQQTGPASPSVRLELQADCYAGAALGDAATTKDPDGTPYLEPITDAQVRDALAAAAAVGDDSIQEKTQGQATPETWTHGSSAARQKWFLAGYRGSPSSCDTFGVSESQLEG